MKNLIIFSISFLMSFACIAQKNKYFTKPIEGFSKKKISYVTLADGTELEGKIKKLKRDKWLFKEVHLIVDGEKRVIKAAEIKHMYLPQSGWDKLGDVYELDDATLWDKTDVNAEHIKNGYGYFESTEVIVKKKKKKTLLLQLLNPAYSNKIKVYHDPGAGESAGIGFGGLKVAGGGDKSYYVKKGDEPAKKLKKKHYDDEFEYLFGDCSSFYRRNSKKISWGKFGENVAKYTTGCD